MKVIWNERVPGQNKDLNIGHILSRIFKSGGNKNKNHTPIVRELTFIGELNFITCVYVVQQQTSDGIKNYCISAMKEDFSKIFNQLSKLKHTDVYLYLQSRLLIEPFIENDLKVVLQVCRTKLPQIKVREYSDFML